MRFGLPSAALAVLSISLVLAVSCARTKTQFTNPAPAGPNILILGDSVMWGQGLNEADKIKPLLELAYKQAGRPEPTITSLAHSGAIVGTPGPSGEPAAINPEIPSGYPTVNDEVAAAQKHKHYDFVIVSGCGNDVGFQAFTFPVKLPYDDLDKRTHDDCLIRMLDLIKNIQSTLRPTNIIVTTYYPIISHSSDPPTYPLALLFARERLRFKGPTLAKKPSEAEIEQSAKDESAGCALVLSGCNAEEHALRFLWRSTCDIIEAVEDADGINPSTCNENTGRPSSGNLDSAIASMGDQALNSTRGKRVRVAVPRIPVDRAAFVPTDKSENSWIWGAKRVGFLGSDLAPMDDQQAIILRNKTRCGGGLYCTIASIGHPNRCGELAYANAIIGVINSYADEHLPEFSLDRVNCAHRP